MSEDIHKAAKNYEKKTGLSHIVPRGNIIDAFEAGAKKQRELTPYSESRVRKLARAILGVNDNQHEGHIDNLIKWLDTQTE